MRNEGRSGTTLFEIAIALALCALAVSSSLALFPVGLKAQLLARFQLYASAKAVEMIESFSACHNINSDIDAEAPDPWDVPVGYRSLAPDLEAKLSSHMFGIIPLPTAIARRLDSDGDEIQRLMAEGGRLYFSQPRATTNIDNRVLDVTAPTEAQKLVFAVTGYAQANALQILPWKSWPYYADYPSPPIHGNHLDQALPADAVRFAWRDRSKLCLLEDLIDPADPLIRRVFVAAGADGESYGYKPYAIDGDPSAAAATRYLQAALWYCRALGLPPAFYGPAAPSAVTALGDFSAGGAVPPHLQVRAMRVLAHAAMCMTRWHDVAELGGSPSLGPGLAVAPATIDGVASPAIALTHDLIVWYADSCVALAMRYAADSPYDWGSPRPVGRALMTDGALIEWDLFSPPLSGTLAGSAVAARQWRPVGARAIVNSGRSASFPDRDLAIPWGDPAHFTLADRFAPEERCRQLVFWAIDWMAYADCETCPSAAVDASKYPIAQPLDGASFDDRMRYNTFCDPLLFAFRNPEKSIAFHADVSGRPTGASVEDVIETTATGVDESWDRGPENADRFSGVFGADRNADHHLDRGPLPPTVRLRAQLVARFNFYDPRVTMQSR